MTPEYKAEKEASVSLLGGGGIWEINFVTFIAPASAFLWAVLQTRQGYFKKYDIPTYFTDFLLQCCTILFATTVYASSPQTLVGLLFLPAVAAYLQPKNDTQAAAKPPTQSETDEDNAIFIENKTPMPVKPFITTYRGAMMIITCTSILAVDFKVFPRRFAKTESFGTSLMDLGVGSFVFAAGIVAARQQLKEVLLKTSHGFVARMKTALRHSLPLLALGFVRLASVKGLDYAEHVSEYGVHWNFFFTLSLLPPAVALIEPILRVFPTIGIFAFAIAIVYEIMLYMTPGLKEFIILSPRHRDSWLSQNREGVYSFIGYFAIFLAGMGVGQGILPRDEEPFDPKAARQDQLDEDEEWLTEVLGKKGEDGVEEKPADDATSTPAAPEEPVTWDSVKEPQIKPELPKLAIVHLAKWTGLWFVFSVWAMWRYGPRLFVSRRMANLAYVCWVCAFNCAQLLLYCAIEHLMWPTLYRANTVADENRRIQEATSKVLAAYNRNGLAVFLLANLLTGAINLALPTWWTGDVEAMVILTAYIAVVTAFAVALDKYDISIKL